MFGYRTIDYWQFTPVQFTPRRFTPWTVDSQEILSWDNLLPVQFTPKKFSPDTIYSRNNWLPRQFTPETIHFQHNSFLGQFTPETIHSQDNSLQKLYCEYADALLGVESECSCSCNCCYYCCAQSVTTIVWLTSGPFRTMPDSKMLSPLHFLEI